MAGTSPAMTKSDMFARRYQLAPLDMYFFLCIFSYHPDPPAQPQGGVGMVRGGASRAG
jgi:hypothetical protein